MEEGRVEINARDDHIGRDESMMAEEQPLPLVKQKTKRVATLDAFRGLTIVVIILSY